nr:MAG TPA: hypothetical protein [Bacteriophage sp.]
MVRLPEGFLLLLVGISDRFNYYFNIAFATAIMLICNSSNNIISLIISAIF